MTKKILTQARLKELLHYDPDTGLFTRLVRTSNFINVGDVAGTADGHGYLDIHVGGARYKSHRLAWLYSHGRFPENQIDHINHERKDNRMINLREVTHAENMRNSKIRRDNISGMTGVHWDAPRKKWSSSIRVNGRTISLGRFSDFDHASVARKIAEKLLGFHKNHGRCKTHCK